MKDCERVSSHVAGFGKKAVFFSTHVLNSGLLVINLRSL